MDCNVGLTQKQSWEWGVTEPQNYSNYFLPLKYPSTNLDESNQDQKTPVVLRSLNQSKWLDKECCRTAHMHTGELEGSKEHKDLEVTETFIPQITSLLGSGVTVAVSLSKPRGRS